MSTHAQTTSESVPLSLEEAHEYRANLEELDSLAHAIVARLLDRPGDPSIKIRLDHYRTLRSKIQASHDRTRP